MASVQSKPPEVRIAIFGSFYRGFHVLSEMLKGTLAGRVRVVGVATDDVSSNFVSRERRVQSCPSMDLDVSDLRLKMMSPRWTRCVPGRAE